MTLRQQKKTGGREIPWTLEELSSGLEHFFKEHGRYPTATEVDAYPYLPSARSIERSFGGLVALRKRLNLSGDSDLRAGAHSSARARSINARAHQNESRVYEFLIKKFGHEFVHREYFFTDDHRTRADFFVYDNSTGFCIDVFYPANLRNLTGCLNIKLNKYNGEAMHQYPVIFLQMNEDISQEEADDLAGKKTRQLSKDQHLMCWGTFETFCNTRKPLGVVRK